ncbi:MAG: hypothetical protein ABJF23_11000 [Bryobacteraceae bacterium]
MAGYLEGYGAGEERREKTIRWIVLSVLLLAAISTAGYFQFRNYREEKQIKTFIELLKQQDYKGAYALWGCTDAHPCPQYALNKFLEDWGPKSPHANIAAAKLAKTKSCDTGIIQFVEFPGNEEVQLWVERRDKVLGFAPWPVCNPRMQVP